MRRPLPLRSVRPAGPLQIMGGGTRQIGRIAPAQALSTRRVQGITLYEPGAMTLVAKTGTAIEDIEAVLAARKAATCL